MQASGPPLNNNLKAAIKNSVFGLTAMVTQLVGTTFAFFIIARIPGVSVSDFGILTYAFALAQLFATCFEFGLVPYLAQQTALRGGRSEWLEKAGYGLHLCLMFIGLMCFFVVLACLNLEEKALEVCGWIGASVFATSSLRFFNSYYQGQEKINLELFNTISEMVVILAVITVAFILHADIVTVAKLLFLGRFISWLSSYLIFGIMNFWLTPVISFSDWKKILTEATPFAVTFIVAFAITSVDTILLQWLAVDDAEYQVGLYQAAIKLILIPTVLAVVATKVLLPQLSRMSANNSKDIVAHLSQLNNLLITIGMLSAIFVYFNAHTLVVLAYGGAYEEAVPLVQLLSITTALRFGAAYNLYLTIMGKMWLRVLFSVFALIFTVLLNSLLVPRYGVEGAVYASVISHCVYWMPYLFSMIRFEKTLLFGWQWHCSLIASAMFVVLLKLLDGMPPLFSFPLCLAYGVVTTYFFLSENMRKEIANILSQIRLTLLSNY